MARIVMPSMFALARRYLSHRRNFGYALTEKPLLFDFARFVDRVQKILHRRQKRSRASDREPSRPMRGVNLSSPLEAGACARRGRRELAYASSKCILGTPGDAGPKPP